LAEQIAGGKKLPDDVVAQIADRTDGVPLFVEELTKSVLESGALREEADRWMLDRALPPLAIPTTLRASLMERLDRLAPVRHVAQIGAAIGRQFSYALLRAVAHLPEDALQTVLAQLVASELMFQRGTPPESVYTFKHTLVQDAAQDSLLRETRRQLHAQIADALEAHATEPLDSQPELLAQHYAEAGLVEKSVFYWSKAGRRSAARSAMAEAAAQLQKGLDQLALLPDTPERRRQELEFWSVLGTALQTVKGYAAPETGQAYARAIELWEQLGFPTEFLHIPFGQLRYHALRGELDQAQSLAEQLLRFGGQRHDSARLVLGHYSSGRNLMFTGRFEQSRLQLEKALALYDPISHRSLVHETGTHLQAVSLGYLGIVIFILGYPNEAMARSSSAIAEDRRPTHPSSLAHSLAVHNIFLSLVGDDAALDRRVDELVAVATEQDFPLFRAQGTIYRGWAKVRNGDVLSGMSLLRSGLSAHHATGAALWTPLYIALLARACELAGQIDEALTQLDNALEIVARTGERWFAAELHRHKGRLLLRQGYAEAAEELYHKALDIAEEQEGPCQDNRMARERSTSRLTG